MNISELTDEQITTALESYNCEPDLDPAKEQQRKTRFEEEHKDFLNRFFRNQVQGNITAALVRVSRVLPDAAVTVSLATGFIAGFELAVSLLKDSANVAQLS